MTKKATKSNALNSLTLIRQGAATLPHRGLVVTQLQKLFSSFALLFSLFFICACLWDLVLLSPSRKQNQTPAITVVETTPICLH